MRNAIIAVTAAAAIASHAAMCVYDNASGVTDLTQPTAWVGGEVPGADDVAVFDGEIATPLALGAATEWAGVVRTNAANALRLTAPDEGTLALGAQGLLSYSQNSDYGRFYIDAEVTLSEDQTWTWDKNKTPYLTRSLSGPGALTLARRSGEPTIVFSSNVTASVSAGVGVRLCLLDNASINPAPTLAVGAKMYVAPTYKPEGYDFAEIFPGRSVDNNGWFYFGYLDNDASQKSNSNTFCLVSGDAITGPAASGTSSRDNGHIRVHNANIVADGADLSNNVWFDLRNGSWTQKSGITDFSYGAIVGRGPSGAFGLPQQRLTIEGGEFNARRVSIGLANGDENAAEMFVTGGSCESSLATSQEGSNWAISIGLGMKGISGDDVAQAAYNAGRLEISGGTVRTFGVHFGCDHSWVTDDKSGARLALSGGRLEVGGGGLKPGEGWRDDGGNDRSWYDAVLSGGTLAFITSDTDVKADMRLSDRAGGASFEVPSGVTGTKISGSLYGEGGLRKTGAGTLTLAGANGYVGRTLVDEGRLVYGDGFGDNAAWTCDALASLADGAAILPWNNVGGGGEWSFALATTIFGTAGTTAPTLARNAIAGRHAVSFNGANTCFLTGTKAQPISDKQSFTVAMVIQTEPGFVGNDSDSVATATQFFGTSINDAGQLGRRYGLAIDAGGRVGCGMFDGKWTENGQKLTMDPENLWSDVAVNDGKPHVLVWTWEFGKNHTLIVDDNVYTLASPSNGVKKTLLTRIVLGVGERQDASKRYRGLIGDLRMFGSAVDADGMAHLAQTLGVKYGVEAFADAASRSASAEPERETPPAATAAWVADSLAQTAGQSVEAWAEKDGKGNGNGNAWTFTRTLADACLKIANGYPGATAAPVVADDTLAGHKLVSFDGRNSGLALTGASATPAGSNCDGLTVAMVVRFPGYGIGGGAFGPTGAAPLFGTSHGIGEGNAHWQALLSGAGRVGMSLNQGNTNPNVIRSRQRFLNNGEAHVIVMRYPKMNTDDTATLFVDGYRDDSEYKLLHGFFNTRILLGCGEYNGARYSAVDVAEFRIWGSTVLSDAQVRSLTEELAATYDLELPAYTRETVSGAQQSSREIVVAEGAVFGDASKCWNRLSPGQTLGGAGRVEGMLSLAPGAAVKAAEGCAPTLANGLELSDGAVLAVAGANAGAVQPVAVTGDVLAHGDVVVQVDASGDKLPSGAFLTWTGELWTSDGGDPAFTIAGASPSAMRVKVDRDNKRLKLVAICGTQVIIR